LSTVFAFCALLNPDGDWHEGAARGTTWYFYGKHTITCKKENIPYLLLIAAHHLPVLLFKI
jgi:hypothetical protein